MTTLSLLEKAAKVLDYLAEEVDLDNIECMRISQTNREIKYKNQELHKFSSLVYRLLHAGLTANQPTGCKHPEWEKEVEELYSKIYENSDY